MTLVIGMATALICLGVSCIFLFKESKKLKRQNNTLKDAIMIASKVDKSVKKQIEKETDEAETNEKSITSRNYF